MKTKNCLYALNAGTANGPGQIGLLRSSIKDSLAQFLGNVSPGLWLRKFAKVLLERHWHSCRCRMAWKLKQTKFHRFYLQLQVTNERRNQLQPTDPFAFLLPTPTTGENRNSRNAVHRKGPSHQRHGIALGLCQALELTQGLLPREFDHWAQVPQCYKRNLPTPTAREHIGGRHPETLKQKGRKPSNSLGDTINSVAGRPTRLSALFVLEMMGFPIGWTALPFQRNQSRQRKAELP